MAGEALRQQLADALLWRWGPRSDVGRQINARVIVDVVMPAVEAALAAAGEQQIREAAAKFNLPDYVTADDVARHCFGSLAMVRGVDKELVEMWKSRASEAEAALAAARVATATEIAEAIALAIEHDPSNGWVQTFTDCGSHSRQRSPKQWADFVRAGFAAGGSVPAPKGDQKPSDMRHVGGTQDAAAGES